MNSLGFTDSNAFPRVATRQVLIEMPQASQGDGVQARPTSWPSQPERDAARRPGGWRARPGVRLGRPKARSRPSTGVCLSGTHVCPRPRAWCATHPLDSRRRARRCRCSKVRHPALTPASSQARVKARLTHNNLLARRR
jgi:hypothetical protein